MLAGRVSTLRMMKDASAPRQVYAVYGGLQHGGQVDVQLIQIPDPHTHRQAALGIGVDEQHPLPMPRQPHAQVESCSCFPDAPFLIRDCDYGGQCVTSFIEICTQMRCNK